MNQEKIGGFIAARRKEAGLTQAALAERLGITDRAVSKWENGRCLPDASLMLPLCGLLGINVNELLSGERLEMENNYKEMAEKNLLALKEQEEQYNRRLLNLEWVIGTTASVAFLILLFTASYAVQSTPWRVGLIAVAFAILLTGVWHALKLEQGAGYYECPHCGERYVPTMKAVFLAPHVGRNRWMKCPRCGERHYQKKVLTK